MVASAPPNPPWQPFLPKALSNPSSERDDLHYSRLQLSLLLIPSSFASQHTPPLFFFFFFFYYYYYYFFLNTSSCNLSTIRPNRPRTWILSQHIHKPAGYDLTAPAD